MALPQAITREELYMKYLTGDTSIELPLPITRKEIYLYYLCQNGTGGGTVTPDQIEAAVNKYLEANPVEPYTLPIMTDSQLGGGKAIAKTNETVAVAVDPETGQLLVPTYPDGGGGGSAEIPVVAHGTADTTIELPSGEYHTWDEVASLTITLKAAENSGIVNEYMFCFTSGATATVLSLPESVKTDIIVEPITRYECSIVGGYMVFNEWSVADA